MRSLVAGLAVLILTACATERTGPEAAGRFDNFEAVRTSDFRNYEEVQLLRPIAGEDITARIDYRPVGNRVVRERPLGERDVTGQLERLDRALRETLVDHVQLIAQDGPGVLTIKPVLTDLDANRPLMIELAQNPGLSAQSIALGAAAVRYELYEDGVLLAVVEDEDNERSFVGRVPVVGQWETATRFYRQTADRLAALLQG
jgi:hypothetical protein